MSNWNEFYSRNEETIHTRIISGLEAKGVNLGVLTKHRIVFDVAARMVAPFNQAMRESKDEPRDAWEIFNEMLDVIGDAMLVREQEDRAIYTRQNERQDEGRDAR